MSQLFTSRLDAVAQSKSGPDFLLTCVTHTAAYNRSYLHKVWTEKDKKTIMIEANRCITECFYVWVLQSAVHKMDVLYLKKSN